MMLSDAPTPLRLVINPDLYLGECYVDGALVIEQGTLWDLLDICGRHLGRRWEVRRNWSAERQRHLNRLIKIDKNSDAIDQILRERHSKSRRAKGLAKWRHRLTSGNGLSIPNAAY
jgi:hypothetical protein